MQERQIPETAPSAQRIGKEEIKKAKTILDAYKTGKKSLEERVVRNEEWFRLRHWDTFKTGDKSRRRPASAWLFNAIANKHADAMDNYPAPNVLPQSADDEMAAGQLSDILPVVLERNGYEQVYNDAWWYKLKNGTAIKGVFWDSSKLNGLGDVRIELVDILNLFWEPGIKDIQESKNVFCLALMDCETLRVKYPQFDIQPGSQEEIKQYQYDDAVDTSQKVLVVDWYYKRNQDGRDVLHYCKFTGEFVLYATENDPEQALTGIYDHGQYPFVFDVLFPMAGSPCGFGQIDVSKDTQEDIDKLNQAIVENAIISAKKRYAISASANVNETELLDITKDVVHVGGSLSENTFRELETNPLPGTSVTVLNNKIEELKETSGNRDVSQGGTAAGVTAASALAALMEAGSKLSRDSIKSAYRAFTKECYMVLDLIRQFYTEPRKFRITNKANETNFISFDNSGLQVQKKKISGVESEYLPVFDIVVVPQKKSPFSKVSQNELAKEFFGMGFFNPQFADQATACMEMMDFDGKDIILAKVRENGTMYQQMMAMQQQLQKMAAIIDAQNGSTLSAQLGGIPMNPAMQGGKPKEETPTQAEQMRERVRGVATPE